MNPLLEVQDLKLYYGTKRGVVRAVDSASFTVGNGQALGVVGESGSGKSSLALALLRSLPNNTVDYQGSIRLEGLELMSLSDHDFRRNIRWNKISMVFQGAMNALNPVLKVGFQIAEPLLEDRLYGKAAVSARVAAVLEMVGLPETISQRYPHELSGGMKQRVVIAMALVQSPELIVLDEPTSALDVSIQAQITNLLKRLKKDLGLSLIFITHDIALATDLCDQLAVIYGGQIVEIGSMDKILSNPGHPYTERLLASVPRLYSSSPPEFIPGFPPDLIRPPVGCRFQPRCSRAIEVCSVDTPPIFWTGPSEGSRCWLREGEVLDAHCSSL
jgi:oligopeptide/dipeptide ABC transporter ATP-binding protein